MQHLVNAEAAVTTEAQRFSPTFQQKGLGTDFQATKITRLIFTHLFQLASETVKSGFVGFTNHFGLDQPICADEISGRKTGDAI